MSAPADRPLSLGARRPAAVTALGVVGFAAAIALAAQVSIPLPGTPVPITLQPMLVVLAGLALGPTAAAASMASAVASSWRAWSPAPARAAFVSCSPSA